MHTHIRPTEDSALAWRRVAKGSLATFVGASGALMTGWCRVCFDDLQLYPDAPTHDSLGLTRVHTFATDSLVSVSAGTPAEGNPHAIGVGTVWGPTASSSTGSLANIPVCSVLVARVLG